MPSLQVDWRAWLQAATGEQLLSGGIHAFTPGGGPRWGRCGVKDPASVEGAELSWEAFWAPGSPFMHSGKAHVRVELSLPDEH